MVNKLNLFIKKLFTTSLGRGSLVMVGGSFLVGAVSFIFNPVMGVMLGPSGYGELLSLLSLLTIFSVPALTLNTILIKTTASYQAKNDTDQIKSLFIWMTQKFFIASFAIIIFFWLLSAPVAAFLNVNQTLPVVLLGVLCGATFLITINGAFLQGLLKFEGFTFTGLINSIMRVILAFILVKIGLSVNGALEGLILAILITYLIGWWLVNKNIRGATLVKVRLREMLKFIGPAFFAILGLTLLTNLDVVLVKHFFSPLDAGLYGAGVITSRVVVFACLPITQVIFPLITQRAESKKAYHHLVQIALGLTLLIGLATATVYFLVPNLVLKIFFLSRASQYLGALRILGIFSVVITFYSITTLLTYFFLSIHKVRFSYALILAALIEGVGIWFYHPNLLGVIWVNMSVNAILAAGLLVYYLTVKQKS